MWVLPLPWTQWISFLWVPWRMRPCELVVLGIPPWECVVWLWGGMRWTFPIAHFYPAISSELTPLSTRTSSLCSVNIKELRQAKLVRLVLWDVVALTIECQYQFIDRERDGTPESSGFVALGLSPFSTEWCSRSSTPWRDIGSYIRRRFDWAECFLSASLSLICLSIILLPP